MKLLLLLLLSLLIPAASAQGEEATIAVASDLHYLSPQLVEDGDTLLRIVRAADGKVTHYTPWITEAFVQRMLELRPDCVVLSGDLTLNGARESHAELIGRLTRLRDGGVPVLVIPGNHDCTGVAYRFVKGGALPIVAETDALFRADYADFGLNQAQSVDAASFSYTYVLRPDLWLLLLDANTAAAPGALLEETLAWAEEQLQAAQAAGARVIAVAHQNALVHYKGFETGFPIANADRLVELLRQYDVRLCLSGHMHLQHILQEAGFTDIATSALSVWPHHYGLLRVAGDRAEYAAQPLDVDAWAAQTGVTDENLLNFEAYSRVFFESSAKTKLLPQVINIAADQRIKNAMLDYAATLNRYRFAGMDTREMDHSPLELWKQYLPDAFFTVYMQSLLDGGPGDMRQITLLLGE